MVTMITVIIIIRRRPVNQYSVWTLNKLWHSLSARPALRAAYNGVMRKQSAESLSTGQINGAPLGTPGDPQADSSRIRFERHRQKLKRQELSNGAIHSSGDARNAKDRVR